jgi:hypothetical protein
MGCIFCKPTPDVCVYVPKLEYERCYIIARNLQVLERQEGISMIWLYSETFEGSVTVTAHVKVSMMEEIRNNPNIVLLANLTVVKSL